MSIRIFTKQALRFQNPNLSMISRPEDAGLERDSPFPPGETPREIQHHELCFVTVPYTIQDAPDWIKADSPDQVNKRTFDINLKHGLLVVMPETASLSAEDSAIAQADATVAAAQAAADAEQVRQEATTLDTGSMKIRNRSR